MTGITPWAQLAIPGTSITLKSGVSEDILRAAFEAMQMVREPYSENTKTAYTRAYARYGKWCDEAGVSPLPCSGVQLVLYLQWLTRQPGMSPSSVMQAASAIASVDKWSRVTPEDDRPLSVLRSVHYERWHRKWASTFGKAPKRKAPTFTRIELERVIAATHTPTPGACKASWSTRSARDRALWLVGLSGAMRVGELAAMDVGHVQRVPEGLIVFIPSSKTDQVGKGEEIGIEPSASHHLCPVRAWEAWLLERGEWAGAAFVAIERNGTMNGARLTERSLQNILQANAERVDVRMTAHSLRRVFATATTRQRKRLDKIMDQARWTRVETMKGYIARGELFVDNPTRGLFEGDW